MVVIMNGVFNIVNDILTNFFVVTEAYTFVDLFYFFLASLLSLYTVYFVLDMVFYTVRAIIRGM